MSVYHTVLPATNLNRLTEVAYRNRQFRTDPEAPAAPMWLGTTSLFWQSPRLSDLGGVPAGMLPLMDPVTKPKPQTENDPAWPTPTTVNQRLTRMLHGMGVKDVGGNPVYAQMFIMDESALTSLPPTNRPDAK